jgi:hypothetical protein
VLVLSSKRSPAIPRWAVFGVSDVHKVIIEMAATLFVFTLYSIAWLDFIKEAQTPYIL